MKFQISYNSKAISRRQNFDFAASLHSFHRPVYIHTRTHLKLHNSLISPYDPVCPLSAPPLVIHTFAFNFNFAVYIHLTCLRVLSSVRCCSMPCCWLIVACGCGLSSWLADFISVFVRHSTQQSIEFFSVSNNGRCVENVGAHMNI